MVRFRAENQVITGSSNPVIIGKNIYRTESMKHYLIGLCEQFSLIKLDSKHCTQLKQTPPIEDSKHGMEIWHITLAVQYIDSFFLELQKCTPNMKVR